MSINVTLWGASCDAHRYEVGQVIAFKACRVSEFKGKSLNASNDAADIVINPRHPRAAALKKWHDGATKSAVRSLSNTGAGRPDDVSMTLAGLQAHCSKDLEVQNGKPFYCKVHCELAWILVPQDKERQMFYLACPACKKKVIDDGQGYRCERCMKTHEDAVPTYNFTVKMTDCSDSMFMSCLGESGQGVLGMSATEFYGFHEDLDRVKELNSTLMWTQMTIKVQARADQSGFSQEDDGSTRIRYNIVSVAPANFPEYNQSCLKHLEIYKNM